MVLHSLLNCRAATVRDSAPMCSSWTLSKKRAFGTANSQRACCCCCCFFFLFLHSGAVLRRLVNDHFKSRTAANGDHVNTGQR